MASRQQVSTHFRLLVVPTFCDKFKSPLPPRSLERRLQVAALSYQVAIHNRVYVLTLNARHASWT